MERAAIVESRLRCDKLLQEELRLFFRTASPSFRSLSFSASGEVAEFSAQSFGLFCDFAELVGRHTERFLRALGLSWDDFAAVMEDALEREDDSALALKDFLQCTADFAAFAALMTEKYREIYSCNTAATATSNACSAAVVSLSAPTGVEKREREEEKSSPLPPQTAQRNVRVLWDIENVSVPRGITGLEAVQRLRGFLEREGLCGSGVDCRLSAFFHPQRHSLSQRLVEDLDRAGVELVWVSTKREDADRKIVFRLSQEMAVLSPSQAVFVIITSDNDFRHSLQLLRNHGYRLLVIHEHHSEALAMQVDQSFDWRRDVLGESESVAPPSKAAGAVSDEDNRDNKTSQASEEKEGPEEKAKRTRAKKLEAIAQAGNGGRERRKDDGSEANNESRRQREIGWFAAKCVRWKGAFGFLSLSKEEVIKAFNALPPSTSPQDGEKDALADQELQALFVELTKDHEGERVSDDLRCYAHYKTLRLSSKKTTLNKDDAVHALVVLCAKGLRATKVVSPEDHELSAKVVLHAL